MGSVRYDEVVVTPRAVDFLSMVMDDMLAFLLFAGALTVNFENLRKRAWPVAYLAFFGAAIPTGLVGLLLWFATKTLGYPISVNWSLAFGALISPTEPIAVLKAVRLPQAQQAAFETNSC